MYNATYNVVLIHSDEGYAVSCPSLRGCHSQGQTEEEALANIAVAIREWLDAQADDAATVEVRKVTV